MCAHGTGSNVSTPDASLADALSRLGSPAGDLGRAQAAGRPPDRVQPWRVGRELRGAVMVTEMGYSRRRAGLHCQPARIRLSRHPHLVSSPLAALSPSQSGALAPRHRSPIWAAAGRGRGGRRRLGGDEQRPPDGRGRPAQQGRPPHMADRGRVVCELFARRNATGHVASSSLASTGRRLHRGCRQPRAHRVGRARPDRALQPRLAPAVAPIGAIGTDALPCRRCRSPALRTGRRVMPRHRHARRLLRRDRAGKVDMSTHKPISRHAWLACCNH